MKKHPQTKLVLSVALGATLCCAFGAAAMAQAVSPVTEASPGIAGSDILIILASLALVAFLAAPYFKKPDDKSKSDKK